MTRPYPFRAALAASAFALFAALAACGGGVEEDEFEPDRLLVFGDEISVLDDSATPGNARKYTVNALDEDDETKLDCDANRTWVQVVAANFDLVLAQCNPDAVASPPSRIYAVPGARAADIAAQVSAHVAAGGFTDKDLVTLHAGTNDVLAEYAKYPGVDRDTLIDNVEAAGEALAKQAIRMANAGAKVLIATTPSMALTPFALAEVERTGEAARKDLLDELSKRFNAGLRVALPLDAGRNIGLVLYDEMVAALHRSETTFSNVEDAVCDVAKAPRVQDCTTETLIEDGSATAYMWADDRWPSPGVQSRLGTLASNQAQRNPF